MKIQTRKSASRYSVKRISAGALALQRANQIRQAYFSHGSAAARWRVDLECVMQQINHADLAWNAQPDQWIEDVVIACACIRGEQQAWHYMQLANGWRLREAAELRLSPARASLLVERFWSDLRRNTVQNRTADCGSSQPALQDYRGCETLARWLLSQVLSRTEALPIGSSIDSILDTMPRLRTLAFEASTPSRVPQAT